MKKNTKERKLHTSNSTDKIEKSKKDKKITYRNIFGLDEEIKENSSEEDERPEVNIVLIYEGKSIHTKFNKHRPFDEFIKFIQKTYFKFNFAENLKIFYDNTELNTTDKRKINKIINISDDSSDEIKFILKPKGRTFINSIEKKIYVELENIPSFMDLSDHINKFIDNQNIEINFDIVYKDNCCKILFSTSEIAFSFVAYMTSVKFTNKYYRKLRIDIKYNELEKTNKDINKIDKIFEQVENEAKKAIEKKNTSKSASLKKKFQSKINNKKAKYDIFTETNNDYIDGSIQDSTPYGHENMIYKIEEIQNKKKWMNNKGFFTSINKNSFNRLIAPGRGGKNLHKTPVNENNNKRKIYQIKISDI